MSKASCSKLNCIMCADGSTLHSSLKNFVSNDIKRKIINYELKRVNLWLKANKLSLNVKKTKCMFSTYGKLYHILISMSINNIIIENVPEFNYLGIMIDEQLS